MTVVHLTPNPVIPDRFLRQQRGVRALGYSHRRKSLRGNITAVCPKSLFLKPVFDPNFHRVALIAVGHIYRICFAITTTEENMSVMNKSMMMRMTPITTSASNQFPARFNPGLVSTLRLYPHPNSTRSGTVISKDLTRIILIPLQSGKAASIFNLKIKSTRTISHCRRVLASSTPGTNSPYFLTGNILDFSMVISTAPFNHIQGCRTMNFPT